MSEIYVHLETADDSQTVLVRASANPNPERKPAMAVARVDLERVLLMMLDAASSCEREGGSAC